MAEGMVRSTYNILAGARVDDSLNSHNYPPRVGEDLHLPGTKPQQYRRTTSPGRHPTEHVSILAGVRGTRGHREQVDRP